MFFMVTIGSRYEENKSMLVEALRNPFDISISTSKTCAENHACYFCGGGIEYGHQMVEIVHRTREKSGIVESKYFLDPECMRKIKNP